LKNIKEIMKQAERDMVALEKQEAMKIQALAKRFLERSKIQSQRSVKRISIEEKSSCAIQILPKYAIPRVNWCEIGRSVTKIQSWTRCTLCRKKFLIASLAQKLLDFEQKNDAEIQALEVYKKKEKEGFKKRAEKN